MHRSIVSSQKKAPASISMDGSKTPHLLPVTLAMNMKTPRRDVVRRASARALFTARVFAFSFAVGVCYAIAYALDHFHVPCSQPSFFLRCDQPTDAEAVAAEETAPLLFFLCIATRLAVARVLALRLQCRRRCVRRALAYLALALTIVGPCLFATSARLFLVAHPGDLLIGICCTVGIVAYAVGGLLCFLDLLLGVGDEE